MYVCSHCTMQSLVSMLHPCVHCVADSSQRCSLQLHVVDDCGSHLRPALYTIVTVPPYVHTYVCTYRTEAMCVPIHIHTYMYCG